MTTQHTPGPWTASEDPQVPERGAIYIHAQGRWDRNETIAEAYKTDADVADGSLDNTEANARLIAAAPELLAALMDLHAEMRLTLRNVAGMTVEQADTYMGREPMRAARAAIAKAEGR